jgi:hypothetical protein
MIYIDQLWEEAKMSQVHLIDHLDAAKKLATLSEQPFVVYLIEMAKDAAIKAEGQRKRVA